MKLAHLSVKMNFPTVEVRNIKDDLVYIKHKYSHIVIEYPYTHAFKEQVYQEFYEWVEHWNLEGFKFRLLFRVDEIVFEPIRAIDKYVVIGIMNSEN